MPKHRINVLAGAAVLGLAWMASSGGTSVAANPPDLTQGQTVYVPVYSDVAYGNADRRGRPSKWLMSAMLSIRNTDLAGALTLRAIRYYDTHGKLIREYPPGDAIAPLGTREIFVEHADQSGGSGANFIVVWDSDRAINAPIIETVHTYFFDTRGVVFISPGQALRVDGR